MFTNASIYSLIHNNSIVRSSTVKKLHLHQISLLMSNKLVHSIRILKQVGTAFSACLIKSSNVLLLYLGCFLLINNNNISSMLVSWQWNQCRWRSKRSVPYIVYALLWLNPIYVKINSMFRFNYKLINTLVAFAATKFLLIGNSVDGSEKLF